MALPSQSSILPPQTNEFFQRKNSLGICNLFGEIGKIWHQGHGGIIWEFMEQHKHGFLHKPQIIGISLLMEKGIFSLNIWWLWMRWINEMALARVGNKGHLS